MGNRIPESMKDDFNPPDIEPKDPPEEQPDLTARPKPIFPPHGTEVGKGMTPDDPRVPLVKRTKDGREVQVTLHGVGLCLRCGLWYLRTKPNQQYCHECRFWRDLEREAGTDVKDWLVRARDMGVKAGLTPEQLTERVPRKYGDHGSVTCSGAEDLAAQLLAVEPVPPIYVMFCATGIAPTLLQQMLDESNQHFAGFRKMVAYYHTRASAFFVFAEHIRHLDNLLKEVEKVSTRDKSGATAKQRADIVMQKAKLRMMESDLLPAPPKTLGDAAAGAFAPDADLLAEARKVVDRAHRAITRGPRR